MIKNKSKLSKKQKEQVTDLVNNIVDIYKDFYITKNNLRLFIRDNLEVLFNDLNLGDKIFIDEKGLLVICGFSDQAFRKYIKILADNTVTDNLISAACEKYNNIDLFVKMKKNNPSLQFFYKHGFSFAGDRGKEILLIKKAEKIDAVNPAK